MDYLIPLWQHQLEGVERAVARHKKGESAKDPRLSGYYFAMEPGTGKTCTTINTIRKVWNSKQRLPRILIFCPPIVINNWKAEWRMHSKIPPDQITCLSGAGKKRLELLLNNGYKEPGVRQPHIFITNYEALLMLDLYTAMKEWGPEVVVFDEIHKLKEFKSKRSKLAERLVNHQMKPDENRWSLRGPRPDVYGLSGTPILNSPMDIFHQYKVLDAGLTFGTNFFGFRNRYFQDKNAGMPSGKHFPDWRPLPGAMEEIAKKLEYNSMRVLKKDCLDLPPLVRQTIEVEMTPGQAKLYKDMLEDYVAYFERDGKEHVATAMLAITKGLRLMQLASGFVKTVEEKEVDVVAEGFNPKQEALYQILQELTPHHKVLVWAVWRKNYEQIRAVFEKLGIEWVEVHGDISQRDKMVAIERLNNDERCRVLLGHPKSGGIGSNLAQASYSIFYSRGFSLEDDLQAAARNYRGGSEIHEKVTRIDLVTRGTIEEEIVAKLANKEEIGATVLRSITLSIKKS